MWMKKFSDYEWEFILIYVFNNFNELKHMEML